MYSVYQEDEREETKSPDSKGNNDNTLIVSPTKTLKMSEIKYGFYEKTEKKERSI